MNFSFLGRFRNHIVLVIVGLLLLSGCSTLKNSWGGSARQKMTEYQKAHATFREQVGWRKKTYRHLNLLAQATAQNTAMEIALREQRGILLVNGAVAMDFPVATGRSSHPTPRGSFKVLDKRKDYASNLYGRIISETGETLVADADTRTDIVPAGAQFEGSRMPYWMRITPTGIGLHVGYVPGRPASHGCIRLKKETATDLFRIIALGTPVTIDYFAPSLGGPLGADSIVTTESAHTPPPPKPSAKACLSPPQKKEKV